jgi:hypothetical protein
MALVKCRECKREISSKAHKCPNCGAKPKNTVAIGCVGVMGLLVFIIIIASIFGSDPKTAVTENESASFMCGEFIKRRLRDPDSAEFVSEPVLTPAVRNPEGSYIALLTVRAANGFGGKSVETFSCTVMKDARGNWQLENLANLGAQ